MTTKTIKTILFVGLIAAMILPFSVMDVSAASDNTTNEQSEIDIAKAKSDSDRAIMVEKYGYELTNSLAFRNDARDSMLAQGYELYPIGWIHRDRIQADIAWMEHPNGSGELILDGDTMKKQYDELVLAALNEDGVSLHDPAAGNAQSSYEIAVKDDPQNDIEYSRAYWNVPNSPVSYDGQTNYNFNAVQPDLIAADTILQPVLQHGFSNTCDAGDNWVTYPFMIIYGIIIEGECVSASEGDLIQGILTKDVEFDVWTVLIKNYANLESVDSVAIGTNADMTALFVATETFNVPTDDCDKLQGDVQYRYMSDLGDVDSWEAMSAHTPFCVMHTNILGDGIVEFINSN